MSDTARRDSHDAHDEPLDAHLRAALRHAPDRDTAPPPALSARLIAAARAAAAPPQADTAAAPPPLGAGARAASREAPGPAPWQATGPASRRARPDAGVAAHAGASSWRDRLARLVVAWQRPGAQAAFASLALAGVIGWVWRDGPPPDEPAMPPRAAAPAAADPQDLEGRAAIAGGSQAAPDAAPPQAEAAPAQPRPEAMAAPRRAAAPPAPDPLAAPARRLATARPGSTAPGAVARAPAPAATARMPATGAEQEAAARTRDGLTSRRESTTDAAAERNPSTGRWAAWLREARRAAAGRWSGPAAGPLPAGTRELRDAEGALLGRLGFEGGADTLVWQAAGEPATVWRATLAPETAARLRATWPEAATDEGAPAPAQDASPPMPPEPGGR